MSFNQQVIEILNKEEKASVQTVSMKTGLTLNYVRVQLRFMEQSGVIEKVDERQPIIYKLAPNSPVVRNAEAVAKAKTNLLTPISDKDGFVSEYLKKYPKSKWAGSIEYLRIMAEAVEQLETEGKLIDTL